MYYTKQILLQLTQSEEKALQEYIKNYQAYFLAMVDFMHKSGNLLYDSFTFPSIMHYKNRKYLYQLALKKYIADRSKKSFQYNRCTTFVPATFQLSDNTLILKLGRKASRKTICATLIKDSTNENWQFERMIRLDLLQNNQQWYANITISK